MSDFLVRLSIRSAMFAGAIAGFVFGLFAGGTLGALLAWFAGALADWQSQLAYSLGVTQQLIPGGDQAGSLVSLSDRWYFVIPACGVAVGLLSALIGVLAGGLWAALVNLGVLPIEVAVYQQDAEAGATHAIRKDRRARPRRRRAMGE